MADRPAPLVRNWRPSGWKRTHLTLSAGATAVMLTVSASAIVSTHRKWWPTAITPPAGPITWVTESNVCPHRTSPVSAGSFTTSNAGSVPRRSTPTGDGSAQLTAAAMAPALSATESTTRRWWPTSRSPPAGPITWVTESYAAGGHESRRPAPTFCAASRGSTPTGDGSPQLDAAALAPASSASGINHRRTEDRLMEFMRGLPGHGVLREMMQHPGDVLIPLTPSLLSDSDPGRLGRGQVAKEVQRIGDLGDAERIDPG